MSADMVPRNTVIEVQRLWRGEWVSLPGLCFRRRSSADAALARARERHPEGQYRLHILTIGDER